MDEIESYIFGLLLTDGNLYLDSRSRGKVSLEVNIIDEDIIDKLCTIIPNSKKLYRKRTTNYKENVSCVRFYNCRKEFRDKLIIQGFPIKNKTINADIPTCVYNENAFWRGVIDGDGSIGITANNEPFISLTTKSEFLKDSFLKFLYNNFNIEKHINRNKRDNVYNIMIKNDKAINIINEIYKDSSIHLDRKYNKYKSII